MHDFKLSGSVVCGRDNGVDGGDKDTVKNVKMVYYFHSSVVLNGYCVV